MDGAGLGSEVTGAAVGELVTGLEVGVEVVGEVVGDMVGAGVAGWKVGVVVGCDVVGDSVGLDDSGESVGDVVGAFVGDFPQLEVSMTTAGSLRKYAAVLKQPARTPVSTPPPQSQPHNATPSITSALRHFSHVVLASKHRCCWAVIVASNAHKSSVSKQRDVSAKHP